MTLVVDEDIPVRMADGVALAADVFRPARPGRYPVIVMRTPYGKRAWPGIAASGIDPLAFAREGYVTVAQDCRGTGSSGGVFRGLQDEGLDGAATIAWAAAQSWSNGRIAMIGGSYLGATQLLAASESPPALRAITPYVTSGWETRHQGGAFRLGISLYWCAAMARDALTRSGADDAQRERVDAILTNLHAAYRQLPLADVARISPWFEATYGEWLRGAMVGATAAHARAVRAPGLHIAGWHDFLLDNSLRVFEELRRNAATEHARANQRLIVTPWGHGPSGEVIGDVWLGPHAQLDFFRTHLEWFERWLKDVPLEGDPVRIFVQGTNRWRGEAGWPPSRARATRWFLQAGGELSESAPRAAPPSEYAYDPAYPVPTTSGQAGLLGADGAFAVGPRDRRALHDRPDVLLYVSPVLQEDYEVTGPVVATLHVVTSALDTDFTVTLVDVHPDGRAIGVTDGILRLRYREGLDRPRLAEPGRPYEITIDMVATSNTFLAGHRIAVEVSSSNFPRFDRNPNHGGENPEATERDFVVARQKIFHDAERASHVTLPHVR